MNIRSAALPLVTVAGATALAGYIREVVIAARFGAGTTTDAFFFSLSIIQTCHDLLFVGTLGACVVPLLARPSRHDEHVKSDANFVLTIAWVTGATALLLAGLLWSWLPAILGALTPGMSHVTSLTAISLGRALVLLLPLNALVTLFALVLTVRQRFVAAALPALLTNVLFVAVVATLSFSLDQNALLVACYAGPIISVALLILQLIKLGLLDAIVPRAPLHVLAAVWPLSWPTLATAGLGSSLGLIMASHVIVRSFAAAHGEGAIAAVSYAFKIYEVPLSLIVNPSAMILFPMFAAMRSAGQMREFAQLMRRLVVWGLIILFPIAVITWFGADIIIDLLLRRGRFGADAARVTADALRGFAPAIVFEAGIVILFRAFNALHHPRVPVAVALVILACVIGLMRASVGYSLTANALAMSAAFGIALVALLARLVSLFGRSDILDGAALARWGVGSLAALGVAWLVCLGNGANVLPVIGSFLIAYAIAIFVLLPDCRQEARAFIQGRSVYGPASANTPS